MYFDGKGKIWDPLTRFFGKREVAAMDEQVSARMMRTACEP
jgi:hypothetical protein